MSKYFSILSSLMLVLYVLYTSLMLPESVKELAIMPDNQELLTELQTRLDEAEPENIRAVAQMMINDRVKVVEGGNQLTLNVIDVFINADKVLVGLLLIHFAALISQLGLLRRWNLTRP